MSSPLSPTSQAAFAADAVQVADEILCAHGSFAYAANAAERAAAKGRLGSDLIAAVSRAAVNVAKAADDARLLTESLTTRIAENAAEVASLEKARLRRQKRDAEWNSLMARRSSAESSRAAALPTQFGDRAYWDALDAIDPDRSCKTERASADEASGALSRRDDGCAPHYKVLIQNIPVSWGMTAISNWLNCLERSPDVIGFHVPRGSGVVLTFDSKAAADVAWRYLDDRRLMDGAPSTITTWLA